MNFSMKKAVLLLLTVSLCMGFTACGTSGTPISDDTAGKNGESANTTAAPETTAPVTTVAPEPTTDPVQQTPQTYPLGKNTKGVKVLGVRNEPSSTWITCDWTCSGFEMNVNCTAAGDMTFEAISNAGAYFRAYIDGKAWVGTSTYYTVSNTLSKIVLKDVPAGAHTVRLIKVTGHTLATAQVTSVTFCGTISDTAPAEKELYIEFVGDSICCGWGLIGAHDGDFTAQDGSLAYPYLTASAMNADYSVTALSGQGLLMGNPGIENGYLLTSPRRSTNAYGFTRKANVVVINIGTNDYGYRESEHITAEQFGTAYLRFLQTVREKNAGCRVICLYNAMNDTFSDQIKSAVSEMGGEESGIWLLSLTRAKSGHPDIAEQAAYATELKPVIEQALAATIQSNYLLTAEQSGDGMSVSYNDFKKLN